jgi:hypothetical protein
MDKPKVYLHGSYIGTTGYNNHTRDFLRELKNRINVKVRNFTVGQTWKGFNDTPHDDEPYINDVDKSLLYKQIILVQKSHTMFGNLHYNLNSSSTNF